MSNVSIYTLTSSLHDAKAIDTATTEFLESLKLGFDLKGANYDDYGTAPLSVIYVRTGGTEGIFQSLLPQLLRQSPCPIYLLTSGKSNSLAASMEILSYLRQQGLKGEILHGSPQHIALRIHDLMQVSIARQRMQGQRLGVIGQPSDWLISSHADATSVFSKLGIELLEINIQEVLDAFSATSLSNKDIHITSNPVSAPAVSAALPDAKRLYFALRQVVERHQLAGFTIRCFDLLTAVHNTGCLALALLNSEGIVAGCEGDVPAMLSMAIAQSLLGVTGFQSNPASIDPDTGLITLAHCTIPLNLVERYELDTHYESGIGVGIRGYVSTGPVTIFKVSGNLSRHFTAHGALRQCDSRPDLCRTQLVVQLSDKGLVNYFLTNPIGNHHIVIPGQHAALLDQFMQSLHR